MADGSTKPIEQVKDGYWVLAEDPDTYKLEMKRVIGTFSHLTPVTVTIALTDPSNGKTLDTLTCTPDHPIYVLGKNWMAASGLVAGDQVVARNGGTLIVGSVTWQRDEENQIRVYNLTIEDDHTYFAGVGGGGVWVHNDCFPAEIRNGRPVRTGPAFASRDDAVPHMKGGGDIICESSVEASSAARGASYRGTTYEDTARGYGPNYLPHWHPGPVA